MRTLRRSALGSVGVMLAVLLAAGGCDRDSSTPIADDGEGPAGVTSGGGLLSPAPTPGLSFTLRDADAPAPGQPDGDEVVQGVPLSQEALDELLDRLPPLPETEAVTTTFALRQGPKPPPLSGETVQAPFPAPTTDASRDDVAVEPLAVQRYQPEGDVAVASHLAVTFDQPMVPLATHAVLAAADVPVQLSPEPEGEWRWVGTQTLLFEPELRFPMATEYTAVVPAGTVSAAGGVLEDEVTWRFRTPPPALVEHHPTGGPTDRVPLIFLEFDQEVRAEDVLAHTVLTAGRTRADIVLASEEEIDADDRVRSLVARAHEGRWVVLRPVEPLPLGVEAAIVVGPDLPSAEGPLTSVEEDEFSFDVYSALEVTETTCPGGDDGLFGDPAKGCLPMSGWRIEFNNPLDHSTVDASSIVVTPEVVGLRVESHDDTVHVAGMTQGRTKYEVELPASLGDVFGQTLGDTVEVTFETGDADPMLAAPGSDTVVLDPSGPRTLDVLSVNNDELDVTLYRVDSSDWPAYATFRDQWNRTEGGTPPGDLVWQGTVSPSGKRDALVSVPIDLSPALEDGPGHVIAIVAPSDWSPDDDSWANRPLSRWVQATELGLTALADGYGIVAWVTRLSDGAPVSGAVVELAPSGETATTGGDGIAGLESLPERTRDWQPGTSLAARLGDDSTFLARTHGGGWFQNTPDDTLRWYAFEDRGIYKPGEQVHLKGWIRLDNWGRDGDLEALDGGPEIVNYQLRTPNGHETVSGTAAVDDLGGFDLSFELPSDMELGSAWLELTAIGGNLPSDGREHGRAIRVSEFRRPEFEVIVEAEQPYYVAGEPAVVTARAGYYAGGALPNADVGWLVVGNSTTFRPPGHDEFHFGSVQPWWGGPDTMFEAEVLYEPYYDDYQPGIGGSSTAQEHEGRTDAAGEHRLAIDLTSVEPVGPVSFGAEATVEDVNRQAWTDAAAVLMHPADTYVGMRLAERFAEVGDELTLDLIVVDLDGEVVSGKPVAVTAERVEWVRQGSEHIEDLQPAGSCDATSGVEPATCTFSFDESGEYRLTAETTDDAGRLNRSTLQVSIAGGLMPPSRGLQGEQVRLLPSADEYQPGDVAEILVQAPFADAEGLMTVQRGGVVGTERFSIDGASHTLRVPIEEGLIPNVQIQVDLVGAAERSADDAENDLPARPAFASGTVDLRVPPLVRTLSVEATAAESGIEPGGATTVEVTVLDADGGPLADAGVALVVVDEAVWSLTGYSIPDPIDVLYQTRWSNVDTRNQREYVQLADPLSLEMMERGGGGDGMLAGSVAMDEAADGVMMMESAEESGAYGRGAGDLNMALPMAPAGAEPQTAGKSRATSASSGTGDDVVAERIDLDPLAAFLPGLRTDASGRVSAEITVPDSVTRYRITAVATDGAKRFGKGESTLTARLPLMVRPSAPRFLNFGDTFEMPVVVQNQTDSDVDVDVVVRGVNLDFTADQGLRVTVPANDRVEVRFPAAADMPGTAVFQAGAFGADASDAQRVELPVWTPATTEAFATYGQIDDGAVLQPVLGPTDVVTSFGGLSLQTSSTALSELTDAYVYLKDYPFEGSEHVASRMVAAVALADVAEAFGLEQGTTRADIDAAIGRDIEKLRALQAPNGGFAWWSPRDETDPFVTVHVTHALVRAREKGYQVPDETLTRAMSYLVEIEQHLDPERFGEQSRRNIRAYALFVQALNGDVNAGEARALFAETADHNIDTLGWLLFVMSGDPGSTADAAEIRRQLNNRAAEEAGTAQFTEQYDETDGNLVLASDRRSDAVVLESLIVDQPDNDLIPKVVRGLLGHRTKGRWASTQENAFVLLALDRYFRTYEGDEPDFLARAWLGDGFIGEHEYAGRTPDRTMVDVPMAELAPGETTDITLEKDGPGRLYYRLGLSYAPTDLALDPLERGFTVTRVYEPVDDPDDVRRTADGTWHVHPGARVRVRLTMVAPQRRYQVALVDPLPAGLEALNPELATTGTLPPSEVEGDGPTPYRYWWWSWYDHSAFRDERVEAFGNLVWPGVHEYTYVARATTPGEFVVPPAKAEEMYHPETFGRSGTDRVVVK